MATASDQLPWMGDDMVDPVMSQPSFEGSDWEMPDLNFDTGFDWSDPGVWGSLLSGAAGLVGAAKTGKAAGTAFDRGDPFGSWRGYYAKQLQGLMSDPSSVTKMPGYQFQFDQGREAISRTASAHGFMGSGNEAIALDEYGQGFASDYLQKQMTFLAGLSGSGISPNYGPGLEGMGMANKQFGDSLASIGYGVARGGSSAGTPGAYGNPSAAGGEAAKVGGAAQLAGSVLNKAGGGGSVSTVGKGVSDVGQIITGASQGGTKGYGSAVAAGANLADIAGVGGTATDAAGVLGNLASGNYPGAVKGAASLFGGASAASSLSSAGSGALANSALADAGFTGAAGGASTAAGGAGAGASSAVGLSGSAAGGIGMALVSLYANSIHTRGDERRNLAAFKQAYPGLVAKYAPASRGGIGMYQLANGQKLTAPQYEELAGTWYGATFAPDGNQDQWQTRFGQLAKQYGFGG